MIDSIADINHWLKANGIKPKWAYKTLAQAKKQYPHLGKAMNDARPNRANFDLVLLIHHILEGRFPLTEETKKSTVPRYKLPRT